MQQKQVVERFVAERFPGASIAVVGGSTATAKRTKTSDIDLLLIGDDLFEEGQVSLAATYAYGGEVFEVFAYTPAAFDEWMRRDLTQFRPVLPTMLIEGVPVRGESAAAELRATWQPVIAAGPVVPADELRLRQYKVTDLLDDLRDAVDPLERQVVASALFEQTAELMLLSGGHWLAMGKHLPRRLRTLSTERADALAKPWLAGDFDAFGDAVQVELRAAGGRLQSGFVR